MNSGFRDRRLIEILLKLARVQSPALVCAAIDFYCHGLSVVECSKKYDIERRNLLRVRRAVEEVSEMVEKINRIKCGL